jgi:hypothetical protein
MAAEFSLRPFEHSMCVSFCGQNPILLRSEGGVARLRGWLMITY